MLSLGDDGRGLGVGEPHEKRLVAERGKKRLRHRPDLQNAEEANVELGNTVHEQANAFAGLDRLQCDQEMGDRVRENSEVVISEALLVALIVFPESANFFAIPEAGRCGRCTSSQC